MDVKKSPLILGCGSGGVSGSDFYLHLSSCFVKKLIKYTCKKYIKPKNSASKSCSTLGVWR